MNKESLEVIESSEDVISLKYQEAKFYKRALANLIDIVLLFLAFVASFILVGIIVKATPYYKNADKDVIEFRSEVTEMYHYSASRDTWENVSTWLENNNDTSYPVRVDYCQKALNSYFNYIKTKSSEENYAEAMKDYVACSTSASLVDASNKKLFILNPENIPIHNPECSASMEIYYSKFYKEYCLENCEGYLIAFFPKYKNGLKVMSDSLFFIQFPMGLLCAGLLVYLLPPVIMKRGRRTCGKALMQVGLVDKNVLNPSFPRYLSRWAIFFFGEVMLSFVTFGIPLLISVSMMCFSKNKQGFPDYMLRLREIDNNSQKIYYSKYEIAMEHANQYKDPVDFKIKKDI